MEGAKCVPEKGGHTGSLLENFNLQRNQAQLCDHVVRQGQTSNLLYPAHRCVLAASDPCDYLKMDELKRTLETQVSHQQLSGSYTGASMESTWEDTRRGTATISCRKSEKTLQDMNTGGQVTISSSWKSPNAIPVQHYQFHSARHADAESWLQSTETQMRTAVENKRGSSKEGETRIVEATQQLCLIAATGSEESQAYRREEQISYTPSCVDSRSRFSLPYCSRSDDRHEHNNTANDNDNRNNSQPLAAYTVQVNNICNPTYSAVEQWCHAQLHYDSLHQENTLLSQRTLNGPFLSAAQHFTPADQDLLLGISRKPPELLLTYSYDKQGDWAPLCQDTSGNQRDGAAEIVDDNKDQEDGENYTPKCAPSFVPDSEHAPISPTSSFCIPSTISANMPIIVSPQLSKQHPFQCSMCNRYFTRRSSLNRHMQSHLGIRPFSCKECHKAFSRRYHLSKHMRIHQRYGHSRVPGVTWSGDAASVLPRCKTRKEDLVRW